ncbi:GntR family transcriptional regulator [Parafannyhessea umbonata]|uniref:GntR family transcriptional regulator n=1 Tax=Parafannyhessea umbonata TaxID=604330 RepID=UPI00350E5738
MCYSFTEEMRRLGKTPKTQVLSFSQEEANKSVRSALGLHLGATVWHLHRLRLADDEPMLVGHTYLPLEMFGSLTHEKVCNHSLYDLLESEFGQTIKTAEEEVRVMTARAADAELLLISEGSPVLEISRLTYNAAGRIIEFTRSSARVDKFKYHVIHSRG